MGVSKMEGRGVAGYISDILASYERARSGRESRGSSSYDVSQIWGPFRYRGIELSVPFPRRRTQSSRRGCWWLDDHAADDLCSKPKHAFSKREAGMASVTVEVVYRFTLYVGCRVV